MTRLGVFGGTFDPVHVGHLAIAHAALESVPLDRVLFVLARRSPLKERGPVASEAVLDNLIWKKLEICHALKAEAWKNAEGYRLVSIRALDAGMLPMALQGIAGDCMIKKALEIAPQGD